MKKERIDDLLRTLPRERAGEDFTYRMMERLDGETPTKRRGRLALGIAVAAVLVAVVSTGVLLWQQAEKAELREEIAVLRAEHQALSRELQLVMDSGVRPVVYLGGDDRTDYVLDMNKLMHEKPIVTPARYTGGPI